MNQPARRLPLLKIIVGWALVGILLAAFPVACNRSRGQISASGGQPQTPRLASLVPAATDLILAMGAGDHLVAVSAYDNYVDKSLPRVGDYQSTDWEMLGAVRPQELIVQMAPERLGQGFRDHAAKLQIHIANINLDKLDSIYATLDTLGTIAHEPGKADALAAAIRAKLAGVQKCVAGLAPVRTLMVIDENALGVVGADTFLDTLLTIAGGRNVAGLLGQPYPSVDREKIRQLDPQAIIQLLPSASPQALEMNQRFWASMSGLRAVGAGRIITITDAYCLVPGSHVGDLAERFAGFLHPDGAP